MAALSAAAQTARPTVIVDWGALDALGPAPAHAALAPVALHPLPQRQVAAPAPTVTPPEPPRRTASVNPVAPVAQPAPEPPRPAPPPPTTTASAATSVAPALAHITVVRFAPGRSDLSPEGQDLLNSVAAQFASNAKLRLQLVAYASAAGSDTVAARRLSLARAVQMRSYLIAKGVPSVRMDVRALGDQNESGGPADRVDVVLLNR